MIPIALSLALLGAGLAGEADGDAASKPLPEAPAAQVLDRMEWLNEERREALETELIRLKKEHNVDLYVVIWDRRLPDGQLPEDLATDLGEGWSDGKLWGTVLLTPEAINRPIAVTGGKGLSKTEREQLSTAAGYSVDFGSRAWSDQGRLEQTALTLAEELMFARYEMTLGNQSQPGTAKTAGSPPSTQSGILPILLIALGVPILLVLLAVCIKRLRKKAPEEEPEPAPATFTFAVPHPQPRLGASWSGGCSLIINVPSPPNR